jgi:DHA1 family tetracycline resistance protein-like MFS transporter
MNKRRLFIIFAVVFVDLLGFGLIQPLLPFNAETFDASDTVVGLLVASYAAAQLIGAPILGHLSDRYGRRPILLVSICGTALGYVLLGVADALWLLFAARVVDGLTGGNISVARAYIADITDEKNRAKGLGMLGAAFGLGFVIGPAVGGWLSSGERYALPAFAAAGLAGLNLLLAYAWLPESLDDQRRKALRVQTRSQSWFTRARAAFRRPSIGPLLHMTLAFNLAYVTFTGIFALHAKDQLGLASNQTGYLLAYGGLLAAIVQGGAMGKLSLRYQDHQLIGVSAVIMTLTLLGWAFAPGTWAVLIVLAPLSFSIGVLTTVLHSALTKAVTDDEVGSIMGIATAIGSVSRVIGPAVGGVLFDSIGTWAPGLFGAGLMAWFVYYAWRHLFLERRAGFSETEHEIAVMQ